jgi:hypothetical protein
MILRQRESRSPPAFTKLNPSDHGNMVGGVLLCAEVCAERQILEGQDRRNREATLARHAVWASGFSF